jgi:hypothetical protein
MQAVLELERETSAVPKSGIEDGFHGNHKEDLIMECRYSTHVRE